MQEWLQTNQQYNMINSKQNNIVPALVSPHPAGVPAGNIMFPFDELNRLGCLREQIIALPESPHRDELLRKVNELIHIIFQNIRCSLEGKADDDLVFGRPRSDFTLLVEINPLPIKRKLNQIDIQRWRPMFIELAKSKAEMMKQLYEICGCELDEFCDTYLKTINLDNLHENDFVRILRAPPKHSNWITPASPKAKNAPPVLPVGVATSS